MYRVWGLLGAREGDNGQVRALVRQLGWPHEFKRLNYNSWRALPNLALGSGLKSLDAAHSDALQPPWPDLVVAIGKRSVPVARWIREQSGGRCRLVQLGRPRAPFRWFDLIVTTPQYGLPPAPNLMRLGLPLVEADPPGPAVLQRWRHEFAHLPRPWTGVLVGGARWPYQFGPQDVRRLAGELLGSGYGSFLVSTSPRSGREQGELLRRALGKRAHVHLWSAGADNPHRAVLALADSFVVTADSLSLRAEAVLTGKPVQIHQLPRAGWHIAWNAERGPMAALARAGVLTSPRDLGQAVPPDATTIGEVTARIMALMPERD